MRAITAFVYFSMLFTIKNKNAFFLIFNSPIFYHKSLLKAIFYMSDIRFYSKTLEIVDGSMPRQIVILCYDSCKNNTVQNTVSVYCCPLTFLSEIASSLARLAMT